METVPKDDVLNDENCRDKNVFIMTNEGLVNLNNINKDVNILSISNTPCYYFNKIHDVMYNTEDIIILKTNIGSDISGTYKQKIMIINKGGGLDFKKLGDIDGTEHIAISYNSNIYNDKLILCFDQNKSKHAQKLKNIEFMNNEIARLFGYIVSEGSDGEDPVRGFVHISNFGMEVDSKGIRPTEISEDIIGICKNLGLSIDHSYVDLRPVGVQINSINFIDFIYYMGYKKYARYKEVPWAILYADKSSQESFIGALFDGDGSISIYEKKNSGVLELGSRSFELCKEVQLILLNMGIISKLYTMNKKYKEKNYLFYRLAIHGEYITKFSEKMTFITV